MINRRCMLLRQIMLLACLSVGLSVPQSFAQSSSVMGDANQLEDGGGTSQSEINAGHSAFARSCTQCHEAERSVGKRKTIAQWIATIRRMARKPEAHVPVADWQPIAQYLTSVTAEDAGSIDGAEKLSAIDAGEPFSIFGTAAPTWRAGGGDDVVENQGFVPEAWIGIDWQPNDVFGGRLNACVACHTEGATGDRIELAEGLIHFNVTRALKHDSEDRELTVQAGRILVPFGAFSSQSHPGAFHTVTRPLMYNMGQNVHRRNLGSPLLPMPYADEGLNAHLRVTPADGVTALWDVYVVNGLQGNNSGVNFYQSRDYVDNNREPAIGTRFSIGNRSLRAGVSFMSGQHNTIAEATPPPLDQVLNYNIFGADLSARYDDWLRIQAEYAVRTTDTFVFDGMPRRADEELDGFYVECGVRPCDETPIEFVVRYDTLDRKGNAPVPGSVLTSSQHRVSRVTSGVSITLPGSSVLRLNHEYWHLPDQLENEHVYAARWIATF